jgi:uncharacterized membrane protein
VLEHLQGHPIGLVHVLTAVAALFFGTAVVLSRKGTRRHRWLGRGYLAMMLALNGTALLNYELYGRFGPFHWMVLASLASVVGGYVPTVRRSRGWKYRHAYWMAGSYVGLMAATVAEIASRVPGWSFGPSVVISSGMVILAGLWLMRALLPRTLGAA